MRRTTTLALLGALAPLPHATAGKLPRGVGPEFASHYIDDSFKCISNPSIQLNTAQVNDNLCDCPDGSDEPGTTACAHINSLSPPQPLASSSTGSTNLSAPLPGFWCPNEGHIGAYVPYSHVNDGICDYELCCDGSEEYGHAGGVSCPNKCAEIGKEWRKAEDARKQKEQRALKKREDLATQAQELRRKVEAKVAQLKSEIKGLEDNKASLQTKLEDLERQERGKVVSSSGFGGKVGVLLGLAKQRVQELRGALVSVVDQRNDLTNKVSELEGILAKFKDEYNPNFNDEGVKAAVKSWENYAAKQSEKTPAVAEGDLFEIMKEDGENAGINWSDFNDEEGTDTDILYTLEEYLPGFARTYMQNQINNLRIWLIENGMLADRKPSAGESRLVTAAREARDAAERDVRSRESTLAEQERDLDKNYGADDIFRALQGKCISTESGEYVYEVCWLDKTTQKPKKGGGGNTGMGRFERIDIATSEEEERLDGKGLGSGPRLVLRYENGQGCWNGPQRRTDVWLACSESEELWKVSEAEKCVYRMEVGTPAACGVLEGRSGAGQRGERDEL